MGLRDKVALSCVVLLLCKTIVTCMPRSLRKDLYKNQFSNNDFFKKNDYFEEPTVQKTFFPEVEYPMDSSPRLPYYFSNTEPVCPKRPQNVDTFKDSALIKKLKQEARQKRKNNHHAKENSLDSHNTGLAPGNPNFVSEIGAFPEMQYPLTASDTWGHYFFNPIPFNKEDAMFKQNDNYYSKKKQAQTYLKPSSMTGNKGMFALVTSKTKETVKPDPSKIIQEKKLADLKMKPEEPLSNQFEKLTRKDREKLKLRLLESILQKDKDKSKLSLLENKERLKASLLDSILMKDSGKSILKSLEGTDKPKSTALINHKGKENFHIDRQDDEKLKLAPGQSPIDDEKSLPIGESFDSHEYIKEVISNVNEYPDILLSVEDIAPISEENIERTFNVDLPLKYELSIDEIEPEHFSEWLSSVDFDKDKLTEFENENKWNKSICDLLSKEDINAPDCQNMQNNKTLINEDFIGDLNQDKLDSTLKDPDSPSKYELSLEEVISNNASNLPNLIDLKKDILPETEYINEQNACTLFAIEDENVTYCNKNLQNETLSQSSDNDLIDKDFILEVLSDLILKSVKEKSSKGKGILNTYNKLTLPNDTGISVDNQKTTKTVIENPLSAKILEANDDSVDEIKPLQETDSKYVEILSEQIDKSKFIRDKSSLKTLENYVVSSVSENKTKSDIKKVQDHSEAKNILLENVSDLVNTNKENGKENHKLNETENTESYLNNTKTELPFEIISNEHLAYVVQSNEYIPFVVSSNNKVSVCSLEQFNEDVDSLLLDVEPFVCKPENNSTDISKSTELVTKLADKKLRKSFENYVMSPISTGKQIDVMYDGDKLGDLPKLFVQEKNGTESNMNDILKKTPLQVPLNEIIYENASGPNDITSETGGETNNFESLETQYKLGELSSEMYIDNTKDVTENNVTIPVTSNEQLEDVQVLNELPNKTLLEDMPSTKTDSKNEEKDVQKPITNMREADNEDVPSIKLIFETIKDIHMLLERMNDNGKPTIKDETFTLESPTDEHISNPKMIEIYSKVSNYEDKDCTISQDYFDIENMPQDNLTELVDNIEHLEEVPNLLYDDKIVSESNLEQSKTENTPSMIELDENIFDNITDEPDSEIKTFISEPPENVPRFSSKSAELYTDTVNNNSRKTHENIVISPVSADKTLEDTKYDSELCQEKLTEPTNINKEVGEIIGTLSKEQEPAETPSVLLSQSTLNQIDEVVTPDVKVETLNFEFNENSSHCSSNSDEPTALTFDKKSGKISENNALNPEVRETSNLHDGETENTTQECFSDFTNCIQHTKGENEESKAFSDDMDSNLDEWISETLPHECIPNTVLSEEKVFQCSLEHINDDVELAALPDPIDEIRTKISESNISSPEFAYKNAVHDEYSNVIDNNNLQDIEIEDIKSLVMDTHPIELNLDTISKEELSQLESNEMMPENILLKQINDDVETKVNNELSNSVASENHLNPSSKSTEIALDIINENPRKTGNFITDMSTDVKADNIEDDDELLNFSKDNLDGLTLITNITDCNLDCIHSTESILETLEDMPLELKEVFGTIEQEQNNDMNQFIEPKINSFDELSNTIVSTGNEITKEKQEVNSGELLYKTSDSTSLTSEIPDKEILDSELVSPFTDDSVKDVLMTNTNELPDFIVDSNNDYDNLVEDTQNNVFNNDSSKLAENFLPLYNNELEKNSEHEDQIPEDNFSINLNDEFSEHQISPVTDSKKNLPPNLINDSNYFSNDNEMPVQSNTLKDKSEEITSLLKTIAEKSSERSVSEQPTEEQTQPDLKIDEIPDSSFPNNDSPLTIDVLAEDEMFYTTESPYTDLPFTNTEEIIYKDVENTTDMKTLPLLTEENELLDLKNNESVELKQVQIIDDTFSDILPIIKPQANMGEISSIESVDANELELTFNPENVW